MSGTYSKEEIERGIAKIYQTVLSTKNVTARYIAVIALASLWLDAYDFSAFGFGLASFKATFPWISPALLGLAVAAPNIGAVIGAVSGGWLTDRLGRRTMFIINMILFTVVAAAAGFAPDPYTFTILRILLGFALGADVALGFTYIFEYLEQRQRLFWANLWQLQWYIAYEVIIFTIVLPLYFTLHSITNPLLWRTIMWVGGALGLIILLLRSKIPESILWLAYQGKLATAKRILKQTYGIDLPDVPDVDIELRKVARDWKSAFSIFKRNKWKEIVYTFLGNFDQGFEGGAIGWYFPYIILLLHFTGVFGSELATAIGYVGGLVGGYLVAWLTPRIGTKVQYVGGAYGSFIFLTLTALTLIFHWPIWLIVVWAFGFFFAHVIGPASQGMTSATAFWGPSQRGTASGWAYQFVKWGVITGTIMMPIALATIGLSGAALILAIAAFITATVGIFTGYDARTYKPPELEEIQQ